MEHTATPSNFATIRQTDAASVNTERLQLLVNGYQPVELKDYTKDLLRIDWPNRRGLPKFNPHYTSTGINCESLRAFDFDVEDPELDAQVRAMAIDCGIEHGASIYRTRPGAVRGLFPFRAYRKVSSDAWPAKRRLVLTGNDNVLEILGSGRQFVAFGHHDKTRLPYIWPNGTPLDRPYHTLPIVTETQIDELSSRLDAAGLLISDTERQRPATAVGVRPQKATLAGQGPTGLLDSNDNPAIPPTGMAARIASGMALNDNFCVGVQGNGLGVDQAIAVVDILPNDFPLGHPLRLSRDDWRDIAFSLHWIVDEAARQRGEDPQNGAWSSAYGADDARMLAAFETFSAGYVEDPTKTVATAVELWERTRHPHSITTGTLVHFARQRIASFELPYDED